MTAISMPLDNGITAHTDSYYAASVDLPAPCPPLNDNAKTEICVIGGGLSGVACALRLAESGRDVMLLEARRIGWGASGRNGGQALAGWSGEGALAAQAGSRAEEFLWRTRYRGNEIIEATIARYGIDCDYVHGAATVSLTDKQTRMLRDERDACLAHGRTHGWGDAVRLVEGAAVRDHVGSPLYRAALIDERGAHCHPLKLCLGEARAARSLGVRIHEGTDVTAIEHGAPLRVHLASGHAVSAQKVILAGNTHHRLEPGALKGRMLPAQSYVMATAPLDAELARTLLPSRLAVCDARTVLDYFRLTADNRLLFGGLCDYNNRPRSDIEGAMAPRMRTIFPALEKTPIDYAWSGVLGIPLNRIPLIGQSADHVYYLQGYSGHGVTSSHVAADIVAAALDAEIDDFRLFADATHWRVPMADTIGSPLLALGMTWFRLRDMIGI